MRLQELVLRIPDDELRIRFHAQLTVLCGIGLLERKALIDSLIGAMTGTGGETLLTYLDQQGRLVELVGGDGTVTARHVEDGTAALAPIGTIAGSADELRRLVLLEPSDLGLQPSAPKGDEDPELLEARATLAELTTELQAALADQQARQARRQELAEVEAQLRAAEDDVARRAYAKVLAELERVRAEAATLRAGKPGADADRRLLSNADDARELVRRWRTAGHRAVEDAGRFGTAERLDPGTRDVVRAYPDAAPPDLGALIAAHAGAVERRDRLDRRLRDQASATLPDPEDPRVVRLATISQDVLWSACKRVELAEREVHREELAQGGSAVSSGAGRDVQTAEVIEHLEEAHRGVDDAEEARRRRFVPCVAGSALAALSALILVTVTPTLGLVAFVASIAVAVAGIALPWRRLLLAQRRERRALTEVGADSYLGFHIRRVEAATDKDSRNRLDAAAMELRAARSAWDDLTGGITPAAARALEDEARRYAEAVNALGSAAGELEALRVELTTVAEPAVVAARRALVAAVAPFGIDEEAVVTTDAALLERLVSAQVEQGRQARVQAELEQAESALAAAAAELDDLLDRLGFGGDDLEEGVRALDDEVDRAFDREQARIDARSRDEIEADVELLQAEARRLHRPEWGDVQPSDAAGPDLVLLRARRDELQARLDEDHDVVIDLDRLADRHSAMERRVASLEAQRSETTSEAAISELADVHQLLLAHLTQAAHAGPFDETVPVILDEPFVRIAAERKWELLDMLRRLGEKTQLVYLSDDPFVGAWARRRAAAGLVTLLEPIEA